jgi:hypothetical protein
LVRDDDDEKRLSHEGSNSGARTKAPDDDDENASHGGSKVDAPEGHEVTL